jgi:iron complex transport system ATP-binding protein
VAAREKKNRDVTGNPPSLRTRDLRFRYPKGKETLRGLTLDFPESGLISILGPNGSGKTTLLKCLGGILKIDSGDVFVKGAPIGKIKRSELGKLIGYVPQNHAFPFRMSVVDFVTLGRIPHVRWTLSAGDREIVRETLEFLNIGDLADVNFQSLSGGQKQLVSIARAMAQNTGLMLLDEPLSALDIKHSLLVMSKIREIARERGALILLVMHDIQMAAKYSDSLVVLKNGELHSAGGVRETVTAGMLKEVYEVDAEVTFDELGCRLTWRLP